MNESQFAFGIDIGGTNTKVGFFDLQGKLLASHHTPTNKDISPEKFIEQIARESFELIASHEIVRGDRRLVGVGAGAPMANFFTGEVSDAPNLGWKDVPLKKLFEEKFGVPAVIENDANLAALGEARWGVGKSFSDFCLITLGTGVGAGLILDGKLYRGHRGLGGEGGHVLIPHEKRRPCSCGGMNHLESFLSAKGIKETIFEMIGEHWTIEKLGTLYREGDERAAGVMNQVTFELAQGLTSIAVVLGPQAFVIGGGVSKLGSSLNELVKKKLDELVHYSLKGKIDIVTASLSSDKGAIYGGAALIFDEVRK